MADTAEFDTKSDGGRGPGSPILLGAWEKARILEHRRDDSYCVNWLVELDRALDPGLVADALDTLRPAFPLHFARLRLDNDRIGVTAVQDPGRTGKECLIHFPRFEGGIVAYARALANTRLDPFVTGLFLCHCIDGPVPLLAFQVTHVPGDGYTNHRFRAEFARAIGDLARGQTPKPPLSVKAHDVSLDEFHSRLPMEPRVLEDIVSKARRLCEPGMSVAAGCVGDDRYELRVFRAVVAPVRYAGLVSCTVSLRITPLAFLGRHSQRRCAPRLTQEKAVKAISSEYRSHATCGRYSAGNPRSAISSFPRVFRYSATTRPTLTGWRYASSIACRGANRTDLCTVTSLPFSGRPWFKRSATIP